MTFRRFEASDLPRLRYIHEAAGYGFDFPEIENMLTSYVAIEDGEIIGWAGVHLTPEVTMMVDPKLSPHRKLGIVRALHEPLAKDVERAGYRKVFLNLDPKFPTFARRLKQFGWWEGWKQMVRMVRP